MKMKVNAMACAFGLAFLPSCDDSETETTPETKTTSEVTTAVTPLNGN